MSSFSRRRLLLSVLFLATGPGLIYFFTSHPASATDPSDSQICAERIDRSLAKAAHYLLARQGQRGDWCSDVYGSFKAGDALTPLVLEALLAVKPTPRLRGQCRR